MMWVRDMSEHYWRDGWRDCDGYREGGVGLITLMA